VLDLYDRLPAIRITELIQEVDADTGFTETFASTQTGAPYKDQIGMLTVLLAEVLNLINAKYGSEPSLKAYTHVSDQFGPFATQNIPATVSEAPYILDGLLMNEAGRKIREQYADTCGVTDHVFAVTSLLGFRTIPRIRDLQSKRLSLFDPVSAPNELRGQIGGKIREALIVQNWPRRSAKSGAWNAPTSSSSGSTTPTRRRPKGSN